MDQMPTWVPIRVVSDVAMPHAGVDTPEDLERMRALFAAGGI